MKYSALFLILISGLAQAQEVVTCAKSGNLPNCTSQTNVSTFNPETALTGVSKIIIPKEGGQDLTLKTEPQSKPHTYWVSVESSSEVDFRVDVASKLPAPDSLETPHDASNVVIMAGYVNSLVVDLSGHKGKDAKSFSVKCAADITAGRFGEGAISNFVSRRQNDPNVPKDQCDAEDLHWISKNERDSFCPQGTTDLRNDNAADPSFQLKRLSYKNNCVYQEDTRQCAVQGNRRKCRIFYETNEDGYCHDGNGLNSYEMCGFQAIKPTANLPITDARTSSPHGVTLVQTIVEQTNRQSCWERCVDLLIGKACVSGCHKWTENWRKRAVVEVNDSDFYHNPAITSDSMAISNFCNGYVDPQAEVELFQSGSNAFDSAWFRSSGSHQLNPPQSVSDRPVTTNKLCSVNSIESYYGRNILEITREQSLDPKRQYQYSESSCPQNWGVASNDQLHFNEDWNELFTCTKNNCPNASLFYSKSAVAKHEMPLERGQTGADRGKASIFAYEVKFPTIIANAGADGKSGQVNIAIPDTKKYCADIKDLNNSAATSDPALKPLVTLHEIDYRAYSPKLPDPIPERIYSSGSQPYMYKRVDSSVRDWLARLVNN